MEKLIVANDPSHKINFHTNIMDILFNHKREIINKLQDIKGVHFIDHVAINIINPSYEISIFSYTPSVEYNLIVKDLWRFDNTFNPLFLENEALIWWEDACYPDYLGKVQYLKETLHKFTLGMNLVRKVEDFIFIYSFATRNKQNDLKAYYLDVKHELLQIGDYGYKLIRDIYSQYSQPYLAPFLEVAQKPIKRNSHLKLIINNGLIG